MVDLKLIFYLVTQSCPTLLPPYGLWWLSMRVACSLPGSSVHAIFQARILEWVAIPSSRRSSWSRDRIGVICISCIAGRFFTTESPGKPTGIFVANWSWCPLEWNRWTAWSVSNSQKSEPSYHNGESWPFVQLLALRHFTNVEFLNWMVGFFRNDPTTLLHEYIISLPSSRLQRDLHPFA